MTSHDLSTLQDVDTEMSMVMKQLEQVRAEQAKFHEKEGELRTKLNSLTIKRQRLLEIEGVK